MNTTRMIVDMEFINSGPTRYDRDVATSLRAAVNRREQQLYQESLKKNPLVSGSEEH